MVLSAFVYFRDPLGYSTPANGLFKKTLLQLLAYEVDDDGLPFSGAIYRTTVKLCSGIQTLYIESKQSLQAAICLLAGVSYSDAIEQLELSC